ncbi:DUF1642 domain-containing protein [Lentilactobacillus sunkii]|uniref:Uncharacterized protein n=1 Tax=Lentilactobacillus sunkii DSM 19904 TaxID=1423808 RepID=A0A0R1L3R8_9LACO|nr:DUF1642 domain-containing protein [Lentilactobacillus sunkii]KRK87545.1 hypothetical protein FD17_GL000943 [Lentilactobacillus sunkii DSM 19904]
MSEKVKVPQWFSEWYLGIDTEGFGLSASRQQMALYKIARQDFGYNFYDSISDEDDDIVVTSVEKAVDYVEKHRVELIRAIIDGYEVKEPRYLIKIVPNRFLAMYWSHGEAVLYTTALPYAVSNQPSQDYRFKFTESDYRELWNHNITWQPFLPPFDETDPHFEKVSDDND